MKFYYRYTHIAKNELKFKIFYIPKTIKNKKIYPKIFFHEPIVLNEIKNKIVFIKILI